MDCMYRLFFHWSHSSNSFDYIYYYIYVKKKPDKGKGIGYCMKNESSSVNFIMIPETKLNYKRINQIL